MSARASTLGSPRNGLPDVGGYVYRGTGKDTLTPRPGSRGKPRRGRFPGIPERIQAALKSLGGEASTPDIRAALDLDGGPAFSPAYLIQALNRLGRREPPAVTRAGREESGKGHAARWRLEDGTAQRPAEGGAPRRPRTAGAKEKGRCRKCKYLKSAEGHKTMCESGT